VHEEPEIGGAPPRIQGRVNSDVVWHLAGRAVGKGQPFLERKVESKEGKEARKQWARGKDEAGKCRHKE